MWQAGDVRVGSDNKSRPENAPIPEEGGRQCGAGVPPAAFLPQGGALTIRSRRLPHFEVEGGTYFVTFRLADALPPKVLKKVEFQRREIPSNASQAGRKLTETEKRKLRQLYAGRIEKALDVGTGGATVLTASGLRC